MGKQETVTVEFHAAQDCHSVNTFPWDALVYRICTQPALITSENVLRTRLFAAIYRDHS